MCRLVWSLIRQPEKVQNSPKIECLTSFRLILLCRLSPDAQTDWLLSKVKGTLDQPPGCQQRHQQRATDQYAYTVKARAT